MKILILILIITTSTIYSQTLYILIHGTWGTNHDWYSPGGDFFEALKSNVACDKAHLIPFAWSGKNSHKYRIKAAEHLCELIKSYPPETKIHIIGHSHGSNVGILASQLLAHDTRASYKIQTFCALATPVHTYCYMPNMYVINYFYNFFSYADFIQPVLGFFEREYPSHERIANIRVIINGKQPGHREIRHPLIARWIAHLNHIPVQQKYFDYPGLLHFVENGQPRFELDKERLHAGTVRYAFATRSNIPLINRYASSSAKHLANSTASLIIIRSFVSVLRNSQTANLKISLVHTLMRSNRQLASNGL